ncbi:TPA: hypothetical protein R0445_003617 [Salmonella enterica subsp. enterica serovar Hvittingfoss]|nr:hypothetical protein [Salmonella enterica subsp. enterica serovar Hvittingfoss]
MLKEEKGTAVMVVMERVTEMAATGGMPVKEVMETAETGVKVVHREGMAATEGMVQVTAMAGTVVMPVKEGKEVKEVKEVKEGKEVKEEQMEDMTVKMEKTGNSLKT